MDDRHKRIVSVPRIHGNSTDVYHMKSGEPICSKLDVKTDLVLALPYSPFSNDLCFL